MFTALTMPIVTCTWMMRHSSDRQTIQHSMEIYHACRSAYRRRTRDMRVHTAVCEAAFPAVAVGTAAMWSSWRNCSPASERRKQC